MTHKSAHSSVEHSSYRAHAPASTPTLQRGEILGDIIGSGDLEVSLSNRAISDDLE